MQKDVTVSKLSKLQKRILIYARQRMLANGQVIDPPGDPDINIRAPKWLSDALTQALHRIFEVRKIGGGTLRKMDKIDLHPWQWFFEEMTFLNDAIHQAAREANAERHFDLNSLWMLVAPPTLQIGLWAESFSLSMHPWPYIDDGGWYFSATLQGVSHEDAARFLERAKTLGDMSGVSLCEKYYVTVNCTVPEMLRDLYEFPVRDSIDGMAFSIDNVGADKYNRAQAALRRACIRLHDRGLIGICAGQRTKAFSVGFYNRTRIGLTERGVVVADGLLQAANQAAQADLNLTEPAAAPRPAVRGDECRDGV
jgi:hypothetical protein